MKPLRLQLDGFGPFAKEVNIDFEALNAHSLFLIHGPTGGGKTTLLDAMCYALYGETSGGERKAREMKSDHTSVKAKTKVTFEFSLADSLFRIERSFKTAGKTYKPKVALFRKEPSDDDFHVVTVKSREVGQHMRTMLGLSAEQFRQVVLLPQGRFRAFLTASSKEREGILESLFKTHRFREIEEALKSAAKEKARSVEAAKERRERALQKAGRSSLEEIKNERDGVLRERSSTLEQRDAAKLKRDQKSIEHSEARTLLQHFLELDAAQQKCDALKQRAEEMSRVSHLLERAQQAKSVQPFARAHETAQKNHSAAAARKEAAQKDAAVQKAREADLLKAEERARKDRAKAALWREEHSALLAAKDAFTAHAQSAAQRDLVRKKRKSLESARDTQKKNLAQAQQTLNALDDKAQAITQALSDLTSKERELDALKAKANEAKLAEQSRARVSSLKAQVKSETEREAQAQRLFKGEHEKALSLEKALLKHLAAELALHLEEGDACPVCGSDTHPAPAQKSATITQEALDNQRAQADKARAHLDEIRNLRVTLGAELAAEEKLLERAPAKDSTLEERFEDARAQVATLRAKSSQSKQVSDERQRVRGLLQGLEKSLSAANDTLYACGSELSALDAVCAERQEALLPGYPSLLEIDKAASHLKQRLEEHEGANKLAQEQREKHLEVSVRVAERVRQSHDELARYASALSCEKDNFRAQLQKAKFDDEDAFIRAQIPADEFQIRSAALQDYEQERTLISERLRLAKATLKGRERPSMPPLDAALAACEQALEDTQLALTALEVRKAGLDDLIAEVRESSTAIDTEVEQAQVTHQLAQIASGQVGGRVTFQRYVLGALLDEVLRGASVRLHAMTRGRFVFRRANAGDQKRKSGGLDLSITDAHTGSERSVHTLSGGESFLAALALALGLADSVQSRSGGTTMDAVFIDEGFGGLDPDALDLAMDALSRLQQAGRVVGIISHVQELRERITARVEVSRSPEGSHIKVVA